MGHEGEQFGTYRATRLITQNGSTETCEGEHIKLHTKVAIQVANPYLGPKRFVEGAHLLARLSHPNITRLLDLGESNSILFTILEPIKESLRDRHSTGAKLSLSTIISYVKPIAEALQYALGIVIYEWLCGTPPFTEGDFMQLGFQHGHEPIPSMREKVPSLSPDVERVIIIALAKDPKQRFASIQAFANAFEQACV